MKYGCFGASKSLELIQAAGFDCAELDFCELADMSESEFHRFYNEAIATKLGFEVFSGLLPLTERFHTPDFNLEYWMEHTAKGAARAKELGCIMIPFGAGKCRSIPEGADPETAGKKVADIVRAFSSVLKEFDIRLVVEPLGPPNSNYLNTLAETAQFLLQVDHENCSAMCDLRHMHKSKEDLSEIRVYRSIIRHAHIDYPKGTSRYFPAPDDGFDYLPYLRALKDSDYRGILTVEATAVRKDIREEASVCLHYLKSMEQLL